MRAPAHARLAVAAAGSVLVLAACGGSNPARPSVGTTANSQARAAAADFPATIAAANGTVHVRARPTAIISISPTTTEMLYAIGAGSQVKAVDDDSDYPPQAPRTKLSGLTPNVEAILTYKPDLVVESYDTGHLTSRLASFGVPVLELPAPTSIGGVYAEIDELGKATGRLSQAESLDASMRGKIAGLAAAAPHHSAPVSYYYELDSTYYSVTSSTFIGRLLGLLGMTSIADAAPGAAKAAGYPQLSAEYILKANPDYILLADGVSPAKLAARPGWGNLTAVKKGHVIVLNEDIASRWGPRIVDLLQTVETALAKHGTG